MVAPILDICLFVYNTDTEYHYKLSREMVVQTHAIGLFQYYESKIDL